MADRQQYDLDYELGEVTTLVRVEIKERPLAFLASSYPTGGNMKGPGKIGKHDYIVLTVVDRSGRQVTFVAEKLNKMRTNCNFPYLCPGTYVNIVLEHAVQASPRYTAELLNTRVRVVDLKMVLAENGWRYDLISENCWNYAFGTTMAVIRLCALNWANLPGESPGWQAEKAVRRNILLSSLDGLERVERAMPRDVARLVYKPLSHKNSYTLEKLKANTENSMGRCATCASGELCFSWHRFGNKCLRGVQTSHGGYLGFDSPLPSQRWMQVFARIRNIGLCAQGAVLGKGTVSKSPALIREESGFFRKASRLL
ncbi:hypothetical protein M758_6G109400 [Ceratodon purpureus]|nr:hypothetical protein M758_6G109400 [Ceratodon purpureus]